MINRIGRIERTGNYPKKDDRSKETAIPQPEPINNKEKKITPEVPPTEPEKKEEKEKRTGSIDIKT